MENFKPGMVMFISYGRQIIHKENFDVKPIHGKITSQTRNLSMMSANYITNAASVVAQYKNKAHGLIRKVSENLLSPLASRCSSSINVLATGYCQSFFNKETWLWNCGQQVLLFWSWSKCVSTSSCRDAHKSLVVRLDFSGLHFEV